MEISSAEGPVGVQVNGEEISTTPSTTSELERLSTANEILTAEVNSGNEKIVKLNEEIVQLNAKLQEAGTLLHEQKLELNKLSILLGQEVQVEEGSVRGNDEKDNSIDLKELKSLLAHERKLRIDAEKKFTKLKAEMKSVTEEYNVFINEVKEHLIEKEEQQNGPSTSQEQQQSSSSSIEANKEVPSVKEVLHKLDISVQERLAKKDKEVMELKAEVTKTSQYAEKLVGIINSPGFKQLTAPPKKLAIKPQTNEVPKEIPIQSVAAATTVSTKVLLKKQEKKDGGPAILKLIPRKPNRRGRPEVITINDSPPVSPHPIPIDFEGNTTTYISAVPNSSSSSALGQFPRSHEFDRKDEAFGFVYCKCTKPYRSMFHLRRHIYYHQNRQRFGCDYCLERFPYNCYLQKHLENIHNIEIRANGVARSIRRVQSRRRSVKRAKTIKPRKNAVKRRNSTKKRTSSRKVSGSGTVNQMNTKCCPHRQVSLSSTDFYACACGVKCARKSELEKHIEDMRKQVAN